MWRRGLWPHSGSPVRLARECHVAELGAHVRRGEERHLTVTRRCRGGGGEGEGSPKGSRSCALESYAAPGAPLVLVNQHTLATLGPKLQRLGAQPLLAPPLPSWNMTGSMWVTRPKKLRAASAPERTYSFHKLSLWDPGLTGERRLAFFDADALFVRSGAALADVRAPAALPGDFHCGDAAGTQEYPGIMREPHGGIVVNGRRIAKAGYYFNSGTTCVRAHAPRFPAHPHAFGSRVTGVMVFEPSRDVHAELMRTYLSGDYKVTDVDFGKFGEQDVLQNVYWRLLGGARPHRLPDEFNFRGYKCNLARANLSAVAIIHRQPSDSHAPKTRHSLLLQACGGRADWHGRMIDLVSRSQCTGPVRSCTD